MPHQFQIYNINPHNLFSQKVQCGSHSFRLREIEKAKAGKELTHQNAQSKKSGLASSSHCQSSKNGCGRLSSFYIRYYYFSIEHGDCYEFLFLLSSLSCYHRYLHCLVLFLLSLPYLLTHRFLISEMTHNESSLL